MERIVTAITFVDGSVARNMSIRAAALKAVANAKRFIRDEQGVTAIEYALIASLIALAIVGAVTGLSTTLQNVFDDISTAV
jgi:pilus assembly protein Flp/PilA